MAIFILDSKGIIMVDYLPFGGTIAGVYYAALMCRLREAIKEKRRGNQEKECCYCTITQDRTPWKFWLPPSVTSALNWFRTPYSPDMVPSDYHLFGSLKEHLGGKRFEDEDEINSTVIEWIDFQPTDFFRRGIHALQER